MPAFICQVLLGCALAGCQSSPKSSDVYDNFAQLKANEAPSSFKVDSRRKGDVLVLAPHGGRIEYHTDEIARSLAGKSWSYYTFLGLADSNNKRLHITSNNFDEPKGLELAESSELCLSVHGYQSQKGDPNICFGGRNDELAQRLHQSLLEAGLQNASEANACQNYFGDSSSNIVNRCALEGVQMEMSLEFRQSLANNRKLRQGFNRVVRKTVNAYLKEVRQ